MTKQTTSIQERMENKAFQALGEVEHQIDRLLEQKKSSFSMYKYVKQLDYSGRVVNYMKGFAEDTLFELRNEEGCEQLEEAYNFLTKRQKERVIKKLETWEQEVSLDQRGKIPFLANRDFMNRANLMINPSRKFLLTNKHDTSEED